MVLDAVGADVPEVEPCRTSEVELQGARGLLAPGDRTKLKIDLGAVESGFARSFDERESALDQDLSEKSLRLRPTVRIVDELPSPAFARTMEREADTPVFEPEDPIDTAMHVQDAPALDDDLVARAIDMGIVHAHAANTQEAGNGAGILEAIGLSVFGETEGKFPIAAFARVEDLVVMRTIHRS
jgi:hypothetical protein